MVRNRSREPVVVASDGGHQFLVPPPRPSATVSSSRMAKTESAILCNVGVDDLLVAGWKGRSADVP